MSGGLVAAIRSPEPRIDRTEGIAGEGRVRVLAAEIGLSPQVIGLIFAIGSLGLFPGIWLASRLP